MDWTIKSQTNDPDLALAIVADQRNKGYNAWIEDENGKAVDEEALKENKFVPAKPALRERAKGLLFLVGAAVAALGTLYLLGLWIDHD